MILNNEMNVVGAKNLALPPSILTGVNFSKEDTVLWYESLDAFQGSMAHYATHSTTGGSKESMDNDPRGWTGCKNWDEYLGILSNGDSKVIAKLKSKTKAKVAEIKERIQIETQRYDFDVTGQFFDVANVLENIPECWLEDNTEEEEKPFVNMLINMTTPGRVGADTFIENAAHIVALAYVLEENDVYVRITAFVYAKDMASSGDRNLLILCDVKDFDTKIDYTRVSAIMSPTFLRRGYFKLAELITDGRVSWGYGSPQTGINSTLVIDDTDGIKHYEKKLIKKYLGE